MDSSTKRIFVGGLYNNITESELRDRFSKFGSVDNIEIKTKKNSDGIPENTFAYLDVNTTDENLKKCFSLLNRSRWKGKELKIQHAKADFMKRLKKERENNFEKAEKPKRKKVVYQDPLEGVAGVENFHMKGAVPGTPVDVEEKNWVVGKYGRVLPIVNIRKRDKRKFMKVDPSKFCHNSKRIKEDDTENTDTGILNLTWKIDTKDSEVIKCRKGEFPAWQQKKKKQTSDADMKLLANYYESFTKTDTENVSKNTDFEVVPESFLKVPQKRSYFSEDSDSNEDTTEDCKTSTPFPTPLQKSQQKTTVKTGKDNGQNNDSTGKQTKLPDPKCTPIMKPLGNGQQELGDKKSVTQEKTLVKSVISNTSPACSSQNTVSSETVPDQNSTSTSKRSKVLGGGEEQLLDQSLKPNKGHAEKMDCSNTSVNKSSNKRTDSVMVGKKSLSKKPKLQAFGGTRHLYDNPLSESQQEVESGSPTITVNPSSVPVSDPVGPHNEAVLGVKRTLFQNSMLKSTPEKEREVQDDSDGESVSSTDTDVIIASAKKQRGGGTVMGYGSLETPVSLQASLTNSFYSEFGGGLVDGETSGQASWIVEHDNYDANDSDDSNDFEKIAKKILKKNQQTKFLTSNKGFENKDDRIKEKIVQNSKIKNATDSDSDIESDDEDSDTSVSDDGDESSESDDVKSDGTDEEEEEDSDEEESNDEDSDEEDSTSSDEEDTGVNKGVVKNTEISKEVKVRKGKQDHQVDSHMAGEDKDRQGELEIKESSTANTKENKGKTKDKADQQRLSIEANRRKQEALRLKQGEYNARKSIIRQALSAMDNTKRSNRIVFDSDSDDDTAQKSVAKTSQEPEKKPWDLEDSDEGDDSDSSDDSGDDSSEGEEESEEESNEKLQSVGASTAKKKEKISLFEESSSDDDDKDEDAFKNKPQFEGEAGSELMKLQMKFSSDTRFKIDQRFVESDEEQDEKEGSKDEVEDEKTRNLKVLQEVVGVQVAVVTDKKDRLKKQFKDISALQYDPSREDHKNFEIQPTTDTTQKKNKEDKKKKSKKQKAGEAEEEEAEPLPVVSSEKFYEVSSALENAFKTSNDNDSKTDTGGFSLLAAFGRKEEDHDDAEEMHDEPTAPTDKWKGFNVQNSSDEEDLSDSNDEENDAEGAEDSKKEEKSVFVTKTKTEFFFMEDDERIKEGIASFCRQQDIEEIREHWQERRPDLIKAYHAKHKRAIRNKRALEKKKMTTKRQ